MLTTTGQSLAAQISEKFSGIWKNFMKDPAWTMKMWVLIICKWISFGMLAGMAIVPDSELAQWGAHDAIVTRALFSSVSIVMTLASVFLSREHVKDR